MGAPIVVQPRQNPWQGMLMQMYMTKFAHNLKVKQDELDLKKATLIRDEKRDYEEKQKTKTSGLKQRQTFLSEGRKEVSEPVAGGSTNVYTGKLFGPKKPELTKGTVRPDATTGTDILPWYDKGGNLVKETTVGRTQPQKLSAEQRLADLASQGNPAAVRIANFMQKSKERLAEVTGAARGKAYLAGRTKDVWNTATRDFDIRTQDEVDRANKKSPGTYYSQTIATKYLPQATLLADMRGAKDRVVGSLAKLDKNFSQTQILQISNMLKLTNPEGAIGNYIKANIGKTLSESQVDYITDLLVLKENALAMRSVLGAGQGSDMLRSAIEATVPGAMTPNRMFATKQLEKFGHTLDRLERGIPVGIRLPRGKIAIDKGGAESTTKMEDPLGIR